MELDADCRVLNNTNIDVTCGSNPVRFLEFAAIPEPLKTIISGFPMNSS